MQWRGRRFKGQCSHPRWGGGVLNSPPFHAGRTSTVSVARRGAAAVVHPTQRHARTRAWRPFVPGPNSQCSHFSEPNNWGSKGRPDDDSHRLAGGPFVKGQGHRAPCSSTEARGDITPARRAPPAADTAEQAAGTLRRIPHPSRAAQPRPAVVRRAAHKQSNQGPPRVGRVPKVCSLTTPVSVGCCCTGHHLTQPTSTFDTNRPQRGHHQSRRLAQARAS